MNNSVKSTIISMSLLKDYDLVPFLIIALGTAKHVHDLVDSCHDEREQEYYEAYRRSGFYIPKLHNGYTVSNQQRIKKVVGMLQWAIDNEDDTNIIKLMKKGYRLAYNYVLQKKDSVILHEFLNDKYRKNFAKNTYEDSYTFSQMHYISYVSVVMYSTIRQNKELVINSMLKETLGEMVGGDSMKFPITIMEAISDVEECYKNEEIVKLFNEYEIAFKQKNHVLEDIIGYLTDKEKRIFKKLHSQDMEQADFDYKVARQGKMKFHSMVSAWVQYMGINYKDLKMNIVFSKEDLVRLFATYTFFKKEFSIRDDKYKDIIIFSFLNIWAISKEYEYTKNKYLEDIKEEYYEELSSIKNELLLQTEQLATKQAETQDKQQVIEEENKLLREENEALKRKIKRHEQQLQEVKQNSTELLALRELLFDLENKEETLQCRNLHIEEQYEDRLQYLNSKKCAIVGGHPDWQNKIKKDISSFLFINVDEKGRNLSFLNNMDAVFIKTTYLNHSLYYKVINAVNMSGVPIFYLNRTDNIELTINEINERLSSQISAN
ncbi:hypothetical protein SAMN04487919_101470 [Bacillus sp. ok061]|uniref:hypothetical protein n=1 Tax=Bacillus sp. ok061 TaxID=1761766 RepID=UPI00089EDBCA|nr:hypothetical protein [Bacillus sp. ok061]SEF52447.1 hypothetical protein SAMN04487919_101470 [Bacillus sp. ok061]